MSSRSGAGALVLCSPETECTAVAAVRGALHALARGKVARSRSANASTVAGAAPQDPAASPGLRRFGEYELLEEIARGGMGVVFRARHIKINRIVALKMTLAGPWASSDDILRFHIEVEAAAKLNHPNIVPLYEAGQVNGQHFFTMRLIEGESLATSIAAGPLAPCRAAALLAVIARALQHAHDHGVIHRDLKPENILLDRDGRPHVADFGVARRANEPSHLTGVGQVLGTPNYMSPEQAAGEARQVGPASDVYSLGAVLYAMLIGRPPFNRLTGDIRAQSGQAEPAGLRRLNSRIPIDLETICLKCLAQQPRERYPSAAELAADLGRFLAHRPILARPASLANRAAKWVARQPVAAAAAALAAAAMMLGLAGMGWLWRQAEAARADAAEKFHSVYYAQAQASRLSGRAGRRFSSWESLRQAAAIRPTVELRNEAIACLTLCDVQVECELPIDDLLGLPDFNRAFDRVAHGEKRGTIAVRSWPDGKLICRLFAARPNDVLRDCLVRFSPDGGRLAAAMIYDAARDFTVWDLARRRAVLSVPGVPAPAMDFTPDGRFWAAGRGDGTVALYEADSDSPLACFSLESTVQSLRFAPHAPVLAASAGCVTKVFNYEDGAVLGIFEHPELVRGAAWSPDGALVATACADGCVYVWDSRTGELRRRLERHQSAAVYVTFNHRGNLLASHGWDGHTQIWDVCSGAALLRVPGLAICFDAADGRLAFGGAGLGVWRFAAGLERRALQAGPSERLWGAETAPDSRFAALARQDGVRFWDLAAGVEMGALDIGPVRLASFERDGRGLITWGSAGLLRWPLGSTRQNADELEIGPPEPLGLPASSLPEFAAVSADGRLLAAADRSYGELYLYDLVDRRLVFRGPHANASRIAISPDGAWVVGGTWGDPHPALRRWDARLLVQADYWPSVNGAAPAFSPDSRWLWLGTSPGGRLLDVASWQATRNYPVAGPAAGVAIFSPDSSLLVVNAAPDRLQMINPLTGREIAALETSTPLCFNREGSLLLTQSDDQTVYLWDLAIIRRRLAELNLDWQDAPLPASKLHATHGARLSIRVLGEAALRQKSAIDARRAREEDSQRGGRRR